MTKSLWLLLFILPAIAFAQSVKKATKKNQFVLFDVQYTYTKADADNATPSK